MGPARKNRIFIGFVADQDDLGGGNRVNRLCAEVLRDDFETVTSPRRADLQAHAFNWKPAGRPRRLFIDHGSFADASFWAYVAPGLRAADTIVVSSSVCAQVAARFFEAGGPLILTVPYSVDLQLFHPAEDHEKTRAEVAGDLGIPPDGPWLLLVSGFVRRKNHHLALLFLRELRQVMPTARLMVVGSTPDRPSSQTYRAAVEDLVRSTGLDSSVHFLGHLPHSRLSKLMASADALVHFTNCRLESFGLVVAEAMAAGLPVIGADWGGLRDLVAPGRTGLLARTYLTGLGPRTDWRSTIQGTRDLLQNRSAWLEFSRNSRRHAEDHLGDATFRRRFSGAVATALEHDAAPEGSPTFTPDGTELRLRTISLNALHPEIRDAGDEYRLLMNTDEGRHYRFLTGPAASSEEPPRIGGRERLYALVTHRVEATAVRIDDPAWPAVIAIDSVHSAILRGCDGTKTLEEICGGGAPCESVDAVLCAGQALVDQGVLCPLEDGGDVPD